MSEKGLRAFINDTLLIGTVKPAGAIACKDKRRLSNWSYIPD
jgi:hypothetical protein